MGGTYQNQTLVKLHDETTIIDPKNFKSYRCKSDMPLFLNAGPLTVTKTVPNLRS